MFCCSLISLNLSSVPSPKGSEWHIAVKLSIIKVLHSQFPIGFYIVESHLGLDCLRLSIKEETSSIGQAYIFQIPMVPTVAEHRTRQADHYESRYVL